MTTIAKHNRIYLDNAATTRLDAEVLQAMLPYLEFSYGNPSSTHSAGREARMAVEFSRKKIAAILGVAPATLVFTSGGTESNNMAIAGAVEHLRCDHILYSPTEHHSVLHAIEHYATGHVTHSPLPLIGEGTIDLNDLGRQLQAHHVAGSKCLVSVMHSNNETGVVNNLAAIGTICRTYGAVYMADCVPTIGHCPINLSKIPVDLATAAAHKFHGPKGAGLLYVRDGLSIGPLLHGGGQERNRRAGTENVAAIVGMAQALAIAYRDHNRDAQHIRNLRAHLWNELIERLPVITLNGDLEDGLYTILNIALPKTERTDNALLALDERDICVSGGSACTAGADSHVMAALGRADRVNIRLSFSKYNTLPEIHRTVDALVEILTRTPAPESHP